MTKNQFQDEILNRLKQGDPEAFKKIYIAYQYTVYGLAYYFLDNKEDAKDITAETFIKLWKLREHFETITNLKSFLHVATRNVCLDLLKSRKRATQRFKELEYLSLNSDINAFYYDEDKIEILKLINQEVKQLPKKARRVLQLSLQGFKNEEIANQLNVKLQTVMNKKSQALKVVRTAVSNQQIHQLKLFKHTES